MYSPDDNGVYLTVLPAAGRRVLALAAYYGLGIICIWLVFAAPLSMVGTIGLGGFGAWVLYAAERMRRVTRHGITLTTEGLFDTSGELIAGWQEIDKVERGTFAIKPSNGFSLTLKSPMPRRWKLGLWWRTTRRAGVGGVLPGPQARAMAEQMAIMLPERQNGA